MSTNNTQDEKKEISPSLVQNKIRAELIKIFKDTPIPDDQILENLELYMRPQRISEVLALKELYSKILNVHGVVFEFGVRWGRHLSVFTALRSILEPFNFYRKIVGFDTFKGFLEPDIKDGNTHKIFRGSMSVSANYKNHVEKILSLHEAEMPLAHLKKHELREGDASVELRRYLEENPETVVALAYFDMDLYKPTKECLKELIPYLSKGSIIAFDELMHSEFPGETLALKETLNINSIKIERFTTIPYPTYIVI